MDNTPTEQTPAAPPRRRINVQNIGELPRRELEITIIDTSEAGDTEYVFTCKELTFDEYFSVVWAYPDPPANQYYISDGGKSGVLAYDTNNPAYAAAVEQVETNRMYARLLLMLGADAVAGNSQAEKIAVLKSTLSWGVVRKLNEAQTQAMLQWEKTLEVRQSTFRGA